MPITSKILPFMATALLAFSANSYAEYVFSIEPLAELPTSVPLNGSVIASYTVTLNTIVGHKENFVKYFPPNVSQIINNKKGTCGKFFELAANGHAGDSCILNLEITGAVNAKDPNPHHHLFICLSDGLTCAGPSADDSLNVTVGPPLPPPIPATTLGFLGTSCSSTQCIAGGSYDTLNKQYPLLAGNISGNWDYEIFRTYPTLPSDFVGGGTFRSVNCLGEFCVAAGQYIGDETRLDLYYPLAAESTDGGETWKYVIDSTLVALPTGYNNHGVFNSVSCGPQSPTHCAAAGSYTGIFGESLNVQIPLLADFFAFGKSTELAEYSPKMGEGDWTYLIDSNNVPPDFLANGFFQSASCGSTSCIAGGQYYNGNNYYPMLAESLFPNEWAFVIYSNNPHNATVPEDFDTNGIFNSVHCTEFGITCFAAGNYNVDVPGVLGNYYPMIAESNNVGLHWAYTSTFSNPTIPGDFTSGTFLSIACTDPPLCVAVGNYIDAETGTMYALGAETLIGDISGVPGHVVPAEWVYVLDSGTLPTGFTNQGNLNSVSCGNESCIAGGSYLNGTSTLPLLAYTALAGEATTGIIQYVPNSDISGFPSDYKANAVFNSVSCSGLECTAAGTYDTESDIGQPLLAESRDGGQTWTYKITSGSPVIPSSTMAATTFVGPPRPA